MTTGTVVQGSAEQEWKSEITAMVKAGKSPEAAARKLAQERPELREQFVREHNQKHGRRVVE